MIATQFFFTLCTIGVFLSLILVLLFFLCAGPDQKFFLLLIRVSFTGPNIVQLIINTYYSNHSQTIGYLQLACGICGGIAVIVFACFGNKDKWMPDHANNWFGWSFILAAIGSVACGICASLFLTEAHVQMRKLRQFKESQARFELEHETKA